MPKPEPSVFDPADERAMREGETDADAGRVIPNAEFAAWLETWGAPGEKPRPPGHGFARSTDKPASIVDHILEGEPWPDDLVDSINDRARCRDSRSVEAGKGVIILSAGASIASTRDVAWLILVAPRRRYLHEVTRR